jgi:hypothetical protein
MRYYLFLAFVFVSFVTFAYSGLFPVYTEILGGTELNGNGCVCHSLDKDYNVMVWLEGPDTLLTGQTGLYKMYMSGGPAEAGGYNVAGRFGTMALVDSFSKWDYRSPNELIQAFPLVFQSMSDTIFWEFAYTASDSSDTDTIYSVGLSLVFDGIPDSLDRWNFGAKFPITVIEDIVPVEIVTFSGSVINNLVELSWTTISERNNYGFEIQKSKKSKLRNQTEWELIGFVEGNGTNVGERTYEFTDNSPFYGNTYYRLRQIDFDGTINYSNEIEVEYYPEMAITLEQNYPNPFNPTTIIRYKVPDSNSSLGKDLEVILKVYDTIGNEIVTLVNGFKPGGNYEVEFNDSDLSSGVYYYKLTAGEFTITKKMLLIK